jgi:hypothetical protein
MKKGEWGFTPKYNALGSTIVMRIPESISNEVKALIQIANKKASDTDLLRVKRVISSMLEGLDSYSL